MINRKGLIITAAALLLTAASLVVWEHFHEEGGLHHHGEGEQAAPVAPPPEARWPSEPQLRTSMTTIRNAVVAAGGSETAALELAALVDHEIDLIVRNCRLSPQADSALHPILGELAHGARAVALPSERTAGFARLNEALTNYPRYFDHPEWQSLPQNQP